jgi:quercetin dioxygenase-like cupin family protein
MPEPILIAPLGGEIIGDAPDRRVEVLSDAESLHATWSRFGPGRDGADLHIHRRHVDLFYVLAGEFTLRLGPEGTPVAVPAGTLARVPPLVVHGFRNSTGAELRYLNLHAPGRDFVNYLRAMRDGRTYVYDQEDPPADGGRPPSEAVIGGDTFAIQVPGLRATVLADVEEIAVAEVEAEPGAEAPPAHLHDGHAESIYVLEGEIGLTVDDRELRAGAGTWMQLPAGTVHAGPVPSGGARARYLTLMTPGSGFGAFVRAYADARDEELAAARAGYDWRAA